MEIPLTYLPRSFARGPPLLSIPAPVVDLVTLSITGLNTEHVQVVELQASWAKDPPRVANKQLPTVFVSHSFIFIFSAEIYV